MRNSLLVLLLSTFSICSAQQVMMSQNVAADTIKPKQGPNLKNFSHLYLGYGLIVGKSESTTSSIKYGNSGEFCVGMRHKRKINNWYALGADFNFNNKIFSQDPLQFGSPGDKQKQRLVSKNLHFNLYNRFNFGKRGNYVGNFIDFGAYTELVFLNSNIIIRKYGIPYYNSRDKFIRYGLKTVNFYNYGANLRIGFNKYVLFCNYRLSDMFKATANFKKPTEYPRITVGVQLSLHQ